MKKPAGAAPAAPKPLVACVAVLDHDGVYWPPLEERLAETVKPGELVFGDPALTDVLPAGAIYVDVDCDLPGGKYRWDGKAKRFEPLPREQRKEMPQAPTLEQAFYDFVTDGGRVTPTPPLVAAWVAWFRKTFDESGKR